ncbi:TolC family protein [Hydrogenimonas sp.]
MKTRLLLMLCLSIGTLHALTLDEALQTALQKSPLLAIERAKVEEAAEQKRSKKAASLGQISAVGSYTEYNLPRTLTPIVPPISPNVPSDTTIGSFGVRYDVLLFNGFADVSAIEIAELGKEASKTQHLLTRAQLIYNVRSLYYRILSLKERRTSARAYVEALERLMQDVEKGVEAGKKAAVDSLKVSSDLQEARYRLHSIDNSIVTLKAKLAATIGIDSVERVEPVSPESTQGAVRTDPKSSYRYKKARYDLARSEKGLRQARSLYYPKLSLGAYYGNNLGAGERAELWQVGLNLSWSLFDFGNRSAQTQKATIARQIAQLKLENTRMMLESDIVEAERQIDSAEAKLKATERQVALLAQIRDAERVKYERGASDMYDLLYAIATYENAVSSRSEALYDLRIRRAYLDYITAGDE